MKLIAKTKNSESEIERNYEDKNDNAIDIYHNTDLDEYDFCCHTDGDSQGDGRTYCTLADCLRAAKSFLKSM